MRSPSHSAGPQDQSVHYRLAFPSQLAQQYRYQSQHNAQQISRTQVPASQHVTTANFHAFDLNSQYFGHYNQSPDYPMMPPTPPYPSQEYSFPQYLPGQTTIQNFNSAQQQSPTSAPRQALLMKQEPNRTGRSTRGPHKAVEQSASGNTNNDSINSADEYRDTNASLFMPLSAPFPAPLMSYRPIASNKMAAPASPAASDDNLPLRGRKRTRAAAREMSVTEDTDDTEYCPPSPFAPSKTIKRTPETNEENILIKKLRTIDQLGWGDIVKILNDRRANIGRNADVTEAAVYGRFKRNAPRIAATEGDHEFNVADWMYMKKEEGGTRVRRIRAATRNTGVAADAPSTSGMGLSIAGANVDADTQFEDEDDEMLATFYEETSEELWVLVAERMHQRNGKAFDADACKARVAMLREQQ